ncbi:MAG: TIGR03936 family radical SAM-associated protein [Lachnospiraceae bacterium]|nr:TIGR03936 family radical SAM-associated protein [Lachnospiraceae bacterium]MBR3277636.1 TIGR03936 family radical SAM-associated protein [Lachnospiraceae bacterium]
MKVRIKFTKVGALRYVGHLDFMRTFQKIIKRSGVLAVFTRGFSPHMIMSFASPLGVGLESLGEYVDFEMAYRDPYELTKIELQRMNQLNIENDELPAVPPEAVIIDMLNSECPDGVRILSVKRIEEAKGKAMALVSASDNVVFFENDWLIAGGILSEDTLSDLINRFMEQETIMIHKTTKKTESDVDIRPQIFTLNLCEKTYLPDHVRMSIENAGYSMPVFMKLKTGSSANLKPETVISALCTFADIEYDPLALRILRLDLYGEDGKPLSETGRSF